MLRTEQAERFVEVAVGCEIDNNDIPQEFVYEGKLHKFVRCNYVRDEIVYVTDDTEHRYFDNQEAADKYAESGEYRWNTSSYNLTDKYTIEASWTRPCEHETYYERLFKWAGKEM